MVEDCGKQRLDPLVSFVIEQKTRNRFGTQQPERYLGVYGSTPIVGKFGISAEYVRNTNKEKPGFGDVDNGYGYKYFGANKNTKVMSSA